MEPNNFTFGSYESNDQTNQKLQETEHNLLLSRNEVSTYQNMLEQSQNQYVILEKKYNRSKQLLRQFQEKEQDMIHREDFYLQLLKEKDTEYNELVKNLKDRIIALEQKLLETQKLAGVPTVLPYDDIVIKQLTPPKIKKNPYMLPIQTLDTDFSDTEFSDFSPEGMEKSATVERKLPIKEELDSAVPPHELLDISACKSKAELVNRGALANRQLPSTKKGSLSNSSSDFGLDEYGDEISEASVSQNNHVEQHYRETLIHQLSSNIQMSLENQEVQHSHYSEKKANKLTRNAVYNDIDNNTNINSMYARVQKEPSSSNIHIWLDSNKSGNLVMGPPPSLAEQLKQVFSIYLYMHKLFFHSFKTYSD